MVLSTRVCLLKKSSDIIELSKTRQKGSGVNPPGDYPNCGDSECGGSEENGQTFFSSYIEGGPENATLSVSNKIPCS